MSKMTKGDFEVFLEQLSEIFHNLTDKQITKVDELIVNIEMERKRKKEAR